MADETRRANAHDATEVAQGDATEVAESSWTQGDDDRPSDALASGKTIGRYVIVEHIGAGGMGTVYRARDPRLERDVALKLIRSGRAPSFRATARLLREATALAKLAHPNIVSVFDADAHDDQVYVAMELVQGVTLRDWLREKDRSREDILEAFVAAGRGLSAAHEAGVVHRDFKPANVMVGDDGRVRVLDFGLARMHGAVGDESTGDGESSEHHDLTRTGAIMGTPAYMAPEQHAGQPAGAATDQFALCVSLYEAVYGEHPFGGATAVEMADNATSGRLRRPPKGVDVPEWLGKTLARGLAADPADRFGSIADLLAELTRDRNRRRRLMRFVAVGALLAVIVAVVAASAASRDKKAAAANEIDPCGGVASMLDDVWNADEAAALTAHIGSEPVARAIRERLDGYAARWLEGREEACRERDEAYTQRVQCLEQASVGLQNVVDVMGKAPTEAFDSAEDMLGNLPVLADCDRPASAMQWVAPPADEHDRTERMRITGEAQRAYVLRGAGLHDEARRLAHSMLAEIDDVTDTFARVGIARLASHFAPDPVTAEALLRRAVREGISVRADQAVIKAYLDLVANLTSQRKFDEALREHDLVAAHIDRFASFAGTWRDAELWPALFRGRLASARGIIEAQQDKHAASVPHYQRALEHWRGVEQWYPGLVAEALHNLANARRETGRYGAAIESLDEAVAITKRIANTNKHDYSNMLQVRGAAHLLAGAAEPAIADFTEALSVACDAGTIAGIAYNLAVLHVMAEDFATAETYLARATDEWAKTGIAALGADLVMVVRCTIAREQGHLKAADELCQTCVDRLTKSVGTEHQFVASARVELGLHLVERKRYADAVANIEASLPIYEKATGTKTVEYAVAQSALGRALARKGAREAAATALVAAEHTFEAMGFPSHPLLVPPLVDRAELLRAAGDTAGAEALVDRALAIAEVPGQLVSSRDLDRARAMKAAAPAPR